VAALSGFDALMARRFLIWFWSGNPGGATFVVNLAQRLALRFGADAITLSLRADAPGLGRARTLGLRVLESPVVSDRRKPLGSLSGISKAARLLHVHAHGADAIIVPMNFALAAPLARGLQKPLVYCAHDPAPHPGDHAALMQRLTQNALLRRADRVVALSEYAASRLGRWQAKLRVAPLGSVFEPRAAPARSDGPVRLLFAGRMMAYKGLDVLEGALDLLRGRGDWRLVIAGEGLALTETRAARLRRANVEVRRGTMSDAALEALIAESDVLLAPYTSATQSGVVAQALAFGKPCVVTPVGALPEQIGQGAAGWISSAATSAAFADAIEAVLRSNGMAEKSAGARLKAHAGWDDDYWNWLAAL
jgi:glycosyltransferase involved in cell wall biosynthesis